MPVNEKQSEALLNATHLLIAYRLFYGGDPSLQDLNGEQIVTALEVVASKKTEFSAQANIIIAMLAKAGMQGDEKLDPHVAD